MYERFIVLFSYLPLFNVRLTNFQTPLLKHVEVVCYEVSAKLFPRVVLNIYFPIFAHYVGLGVRVSGLRSFVVVGIS